jgi:hypothetical protein
MQITEFSKPVSSKKLNENLAKTFGYSLKLEDLTVEDLYQAAAKLKNKIYNYEMTESYDSVVENHDYQKTRAFLDVISQAITERTLSPEEKSKKEKYFKGMKKVKGDFSKRYGERGDEVMHATATKMAKKESVEEAMDLLKTVLSEKILRESEEDKASIIMSGKDMVDRITGWIEDVASMQSESLLQLLDSIKQNMGSDVSTRFSEIVKPALSELQASLETQRQALSSGMGLLTGEEPPGPSMGNEVPTSGATEEPAMGPEEPATDEFATSAPAAGGTEVAGRAKRESIEYSRRIGQILSSKKK